MKTVKTWLYRLATLIILGGFLLLIQPFNVTLYSYGFPVLLAGAILFIVLDHLPQRSNPG